ncbi:MAG: diguanylate cyclase [Arcobacteraceae bacterium]|nr:diguanylate cyclase [Arcobacteraceae bacterium]
MIPTVEEICIKEIITINIEQTLEHTVTLMAKSNIRNILVISDTDDNIYHMFTTKDLIELKLQNISMQTKLSQLKLRVIRQIDAKVSVIEILNQTTVDNDYMIVMSNNKLVGILSQTDIINNIDPKILMKKQTIGNIMLQYSAITIYEDETTIDATKLMSEKHIDSIVVIDQDNKPKGIFTTKDFLNLIDLDCDLSKSVKNFMSAPLQTISYDTTIFDALEFIRKEQFKRLIVVDTNNKIIGLVTQSELLRLVNNKWMEIIKEKGNELSKINEELIAKTAQLELKASTDSLTKLYNRNKFDSMVSYEIHQVKRYNNRSLSILLLDIDDFKYINDNYGHDVGDEILQEIARIITIPLRESDIAARWGGEEFILMLPETSTEHAVLVAEKIRATIQNHDFVQKLKITCSLGLSGFHTTDKYIDLFKRADEALYKAKHSGKNRVEIGRL